MLVKLEDPSLFSKVIEVISDLVTEVRIKINEFGMSITAIDPANVAMVRFKLPRSAFSQFETGDEVLGINLDSLKKILRRCSNGTSLILEKKDNFLEIKVTGRIMRNFSLNLIEIESAEKEIPTLDYSARVEISSPDLISSIEDCIVVSDACSFKVNQEKKFIVESKGLNSARSEFSSDEAKIEAEECKSKYSLEYLQKFMKGMKLCEKTILFFANDHPMKMDIKTEHMELNFLLAPRVETED
ncbi:MAG: proliferating cell nuclear antigen (pcna) [Candidatus Nanoarchaeia archaeon]|nr:proliferating cell nuclear antigen (pcna) [Candidatus Nanoarchaeia archaeon]MDD5357581.1 proliferating cell nuclear antigen (pcna) [Candidatus Nanoarchaeia archaeon]MDD5588500.1 proliferating cell nuclear antigen (pcna) [Candidatus Nanoarchaeia archaeon]